MDKLPIIVMISGNGSNLQSIIDTCLPWVDIQCVISDNRHAHGLKRATAAGIGALIIEQRKGQSREDYCEDLVNVIQPLYPELIVLAGFMKILTPNFIKAFDRIVNIHPSLLPKYKGLNTHQRVIDAGDDKHGITIHWVNGELDAGPIIFQRSFDIELTDNEETIERKVHKLEHECYPWIIKELATGTI